MIQINRAFSRECHAEEMNRFLKENRPTSPEPKIRIVTGSKADPRRRIGRRDAVAVIVELQAAKEVRSARGYTTDARTWRSPEK